MHFEYGCHFYFIMRYYREIVDGKLRCSCCKQLQPLNLFYKYSKVRLGYTYSCKLCFEAQKKKKFSNRKIVTDLKGEIWVVIPKYNSKYFVSNFLRVKSINLKYGGEKILKNNPKHIYLTVTLSMEGKCKPVLVHRLVSEAFIPNPDNKPFINHKNGIKHDNRIKNLEWCTASENCQHAYDTGLRVGNLGERHGQSKLTEKEVLEIRSSPLKSLVLCREYNVSVATIRRILKRKIWKHI